MAKENDIVLLYLEDTPVSFARVEDIRPDMKKDWYHIKLLMLQVPLQVVTWILKDVYINGDEFFMGGKRMRLEVVTCPEEPSVPDEGFAPRETDLKDVGSDGGTKGPAQESSPASSGGATIISLADRKRLKK